MKKNLGVVFIHGAGLGNYIWGKITTLESGHLPMLSVPNDFTTELNSFIQTLGK